MPASPHRDHLTLAIKAFHKRTGYLPRGPWVIWVDLYAEALRYNLPKAMARLEGALEASPSANGWGQLRLVEGMRGEVKPETPSSAQWLGGAPQTVIQMGQQPAQQQAMPNQLEERKRRGILSRLRGP